MDLHLTLGGGSMSDNKDMEEINRPACAACKYQRKKCRKGDCVLWKHFPADRMDDFRAVQEVFGISNITKMLQKLDVQHQIEAAKSLLWEALRWKEDPRHGPYGEYRKLLQELMELGRQINSLQRVPQFVADQSPTPEIGYVTDGGENGVEAASVPGAENIENYVHSNGNTMLTIPVNNHTSGGRGVLLSPYHAIVQEQIGVSPEIGFHLPSQHTFVQEHNGETMGKEVQPASFNMLQRQVTDNQGRIRATAHNGFGQEIANFRKGYAAYHPETSLVGQSPARVHRFSARLGIGGDGLTATAQPRSSESEQTTSQGGEDLLAICQQQYRADSNGSNIVSEN